MRTSRSPAYPCNQTERKNDAGFEQAEKTPEGVKNISTIKLGYDFGIF